MQVQFSSDGKAWEHSRGLLRPQFAREQVSDIELEEAHIQNLMRCLQPKSDGWTDVTNIQTLFFRLTMDTATEFLFGQTVDSQLSNLPGYIASSKDAGRPDESKFAINFDGAQRHMSNAARLGDMYWMAHNKEFREMSKSCHELIDHYVRLALSKEKTTKAQTTTGKPKYVFLDALVEDNRDPLVLRSQLISILLAGRDTTASLLSYVFIMLLEHPAVFNKLRQTILEDFGSYSHPKEISFVGLKNNTYLQWVLNETLRLFPLVPINGRRAVRDTMLPLGGGKDELSPVYVRKGQQVDYSVAAIQRRTDLWGPDANDFKPERWDGRRSGWEYLPFNGKNSNLTLHIIKLIARSRRSENLHRPAVRSHRGGIHRCEIAAEVR
jgi:cytochrome P450